MSSTVHQNIKFPHEEKVITISTENEADVTAMKLAPNKIPISPSFKICVMYKDELDEKIISMMRKMNFMPRMGLGKNQSGPPEFMERKVPILKYGVGY